ncbi:hypothetical protein B9T07_11615 [Limnospira fusiformis CCALA 023]
MEVTKPNPTISNCCWVSLRFTQPTWLHGRSHFPPSGVGWVEVTKPNPTISQLCWVSLRFTQPTWLRFWEVREN